MCVYRHTHIYIYINTNATHIHKQIYIYTHVETREKAFLCVSTIVGCRESRVHTTSAQQLTVVVFLCNKWSWC